MKQQIDIENLLSQLPFYKKREKRKRVEFDWQAEWERFDAKKL